MSTEKFRSPASHSINRVSLNAQLVETSALRFTPAGIEVLTVLLNHRSEQSIESLTDPAVEQGKKLKPRLIEMQIKAQFFGALAVKASSIEMGQQAVFQGYLAPMKAGSRTLWLMVTEFEVYK